MTLKLVTAIIQPDKLDEVRQALIEAEIYRITVNRCTGRGRAEETDLYRGEKVALDLLPKVRIDIACSTQEWADRAVQAILAAARHGDGEIGDGKIFISSLDECIRIRTEEKGGNAI